MESSKTEAEGYDFDFVEDPSEDMKCPICLLVLRSPQLTSCCGHHFCCECVDKVLREKGPCPLCNVLSFTTMLDKGTERKVDQLLVKCPKESGGCSWVGALSKLNQHVNSNCAFSTTECQYSCGVNCTSREMKIHLLLCPKRPYVCKFCGYAGVFEEMSKMHWPVCRKYPLPCPNECGIRDIERQHMDQHLMKECPLSTVACEFSFAGCHVRGTQEKLAVHSRVNMQQHLSMVAGMCNQLMQLDVGARMQEELKVSTQEMKNVLKTHKEEMNELSLKTVSLQEEIEELKQENQLLKSYVFIPPFDIVMNSFHSQKDQNEQWIGPPFYSGVGGYKMCLTVDANGSEDGDGTHVSVYVSLMKGENDAYIKWPFRGTVVIQLVNQREDKNHFEQEIIFSHETGNEAAGRVMEGELAESGLGVSTYIKHTDLKYNVSKNIEYLKNNSLQFRIVQVQVKH